MEGYVLAKCTTGLYTLARYLYAKQTYDIIPTNPAESSQYLKGYGTNDGGTRAWMISCTV